MEIQGSAVNFAKRIVQLEAQCNQLQDKNISLKEELMEMKGKEERTKEQHLKVMDKYVKVKGKYHSEGRKWSEEEDKIREEYRLLAVEKRKLEIDLKIAHRIEVSEREKRQKSEEIEKILNEKILNEKILNEKTALMEKHTKVILNFVSRSGVLEKNKQRLEEEIREKDERIKVLMQEKEPSGPKKKKMQIGMNSCVVKLKEDVELQQLLPPASNVGILGALTTHNQGPISIVPSVNEQKGCSDGGMQLRGLLGAKIQKQKVEGLGYSAANQDGTKRCKLDGLTGHGFGRASYKRGCKR